jgi:hypothetical protein
MALARRQTDLVIVHANDTSALRLGKAYAARTLKPHTTTTMGLHQTMGL